MKKLDVARSALDCGGLPPLSKSKMVKAASGRRTPKRLRRSATQKLFSKQQRYHI